MKPSPEPNNDPLDRHLREWHVAAPLPPRFEEQVWQRIADVGGQNTITLWAVFKNWLQLAFARPAVAVAYTLVLLLLGSVAGYWQAQKKSALIESSLSSSYVRSLDPYQKTQM